MITASVCHGEAGYATSANERDPTLYPEVGFATSAVLLQTRVDTPLAAPGRCPIGAWAAITRVVPVRCV